MPDFNPNNSQIYLKWILGVFLMLDLNGKLSLCSEKVSTKTVFFEIDIWRPVGCTFVA
jgi:hypothetical protein